MSATQLRGNANNTGEKKHSYFQKRFTVYDNLNSALSFGYAYTNFNHVGYLEFAPVKDDKRGKEATRGESVYDYENRQIAMLNPTSAVAALMALNEVLAGNADEVSIPLNKDGSKFLSFCNTVAIYGDAALPHENAVSPLTVALVGAVEDKQYEILNVLVEREIYSINGGQGKVVGCPEIDLLIKFLENCINHVTSGNFTDAVAAVSIFAGSKAVAEERTPPPASASVKRGAALRTGQTATTGSRLAGRTSTTQQSAQTDEPVQQEARPQTTGGGSRFNEARNAGRVNTTAAEPAQEETSSSLDEFVNSLGGDDTPDFSQDM